MAYKQLGEILVSAGEIDQETLEKALKKGKETGKRLGEVLVGDGIVTEKQIIDVLNLQLGVEFIDLTKVTIPTAMASLVPKNMARSFSIVPVKQSGDTLYLAMTDPLNYKAIEQARKSAKKRIIPLIATKSAMERAINTLYGNESVSRAIDDLAQAMGSSGFTGGAAPAGTTTDADADDGAQSAPAIRLVNSILERGATSNASDIHIEPQADGLKIRMRIDGVLHNILTVPQNLQNSVISRIKIMVDMDIAERRIPQDGRGNVHVRGKDYDLRVSTLPTKYGEKIVIRFLEKSESLLSKDGIGLTGKHLEDYNKLVHNANGVILIAGPTGSGKSTTMYTMISELNREEINLITLEDPIEYKMPGVNQVQINEKVGMTFASGLRAILRQDPDVIAVGEIRDGETAEIAMRSAITGHLVLSTIHTNNAIATLDRLIDIGVEPYLINSAVKGIISQRLVRRLCPLCKVAYEATDADYAALELDPNNKAAILESAKSAAAYSGDPKAESGSVGDALRDFIAANADGGASAAGTAGGAFGAAGATGGAGTVKPAKMTFYKPGGCPECMNTGYKGRIAVFEILTLTADIKAKLRDNALHSELEQTIYDSGFEPMMLNCRRLVMQGITTTSEAVRVLSTTD
ncbi:MAG: ATPase, T2SS/T4P/T4SS family [Eubacteriales bacterium]|nr:ATPase, T2SS/T4P/T4SS family [Eubacteriales bacterium]